MLQSLTSFKHWVCVCLFVNVKHIVIAGWTHIDFISLDTELTEPHILIAFPWNTVKVDYFLIERNTCCNNDALNAKRLAFLQIFMPLVGYKHMEYIFGIDDIYMRADLKE